MKTKFIVGTVALCVLGSFVFTGCDKVVGDDTPTVVKQQQKKEAKRQDVQWTLENQAKYPKDYCQYQLENLAAKEKQMDVVFHKLKYARGEWTRKEHEATARANKLQKLLDDARSAYKEAEVKQSWPVTLPGGIRGDKDTIKRLIVDSGRKLKQAQKLAKNMAAGKVKCESDYRAYEDGKIKIAELRSSIQSKITQLQLNEAADPGDVRESLAEITASMKAFEDDTDTLNVENLIAPDGDLAQDEEFEALMAE